MNVNAETLRVLAQLRSSLANVTDDHTRQMVAAWARGWDDVSPLMAAAVGELQSAVQDGTLTRSQIIRSQRLINALGVVEAKLGSLLDQSGELMVSRLGDVVDQAGRTVDQLVSSQLPPGQSVAGWSRVDPAAVEAIVVRSTEQITKLSYPLASEATANMKRELVRGMLTGTNPNVVAARTLRRTEGVFNGGLSRAITIARTEMLDAQRAAAQLSEAQSADVLGSWIWAASVSERTCPACWSMNGQEFPLSDPGPMGHQNCRCTRVQKAKTWKDLGFDIEEPPSLLPSSEDRFRQLSPAQQRTILGPARHDAWVDGRYPMSDWAKRQSNDGWRDSYVTTKAPKVGA